MARQVGHQDLAVIVTCVWSVVVAGASLGLIARVTPLPPYGPRSVPGPSAVT